MSSGNRPDTRALILGELDRADKPLSAYDLLDLLRPHGVSGPPTIYRALDKLVDAGKVHRLESINAFVACRGPGHEDHKHEEFGTGFVICDRCGNVVEFDDPVLAERIEGNAASASFRPKSSVIEIHGLCRACASVNGPAEG